MRLRSRNTLLRGLVGVVLATSAFAQTFTCRITGTVTDAQDAAVPNATVRVTEVSTNVIRTARTDTSGVYNVPLLAAGTYEVSVEAPGFQTQFRKDVRLQWNQVATLDFKMSVAATAYAVSVAAEVPLLQSETSNVGSTLETKLIENYPLMQRDVMGLLRSLAGIYTDSSVGDARATRNVFDSRFSVNGGPMNTNEVLLDGGANTIGDANGVVIIPPQDSVQEVRVEASTYSAEFGRSGGGVVNLMTKAGTNEFHGTIFYSHQNTVLNANSFINNRNGIERPYLRRHQYGGTFGGPVWIPKLYQGRNRTFFFQSFEGRRENDPTRGLYSVPTAQELAGDFSNTFVVSGGQPFLVQIFDPSTTVLSAGRYVRQQFPGNRIPASRFNSVTLEALKVLPKPNRPGDAITNRRNYYAEDVTTYSRDALSSRVDHYVGEKHRLFGRFSWQESLIARPKGLVVHDTNIASSAYDRFRGFALDDMHQFSPRLNHVFRYNYSRYVANQIPRGMGFDPTKLGLPAYLRDSANVLAHPIFSFGMVDIGGKAYNYQPRDTHSMSSQLVRTSGKHNFRAGSEYRLYRFYPFQNNNPGGNFTFPSTPTQRDALAAANPTQGLGFASFLLGLGNFSFEYKEPLSSYHHYLAAYVQDDWKLTGRLTFNLGLRWETETGTAEAWNRLTYFDPQYPAPLPGRPLGAFQFTGNGKPRSIREANLKNFAPRVGCAYRLDTKTSLRGGFGISFLPIFLEPQIVTTPFNYTLNADVWNPDYTPKTTLSDPFPGGIVRPVSSQRVEDGSYLLGRNGNVFPRHQPSPRMEQWNFAISRQIGRAMLVDATYMGSRGRNLPMAMEYNQLDPQYLARGGAWLTERVANPYYGHIPTGLLAMATVPRMQLFKPFPHFAAASTANAFGGSLNAQREYAGSSDYHALILKFERRFSSGISLNSHYTISKSIVVSATPRDRYNLALERGLSPTDVPQRLVVNYAYELPFGTGRKFLKGRAWLDAVVGGWTVFSVHTWSSGLPLEIQGPNLSRLGSTAARVNVVAGVNPKISLADARRNARDYSPDGNRTGPWFNTAAFREAPEFTIANGPSTLPTVRNDNLRQWDMSLTKAIRMTEKVTVAVNGRFRNLLNQVRFGNPVTSLTSNNFGSTIAVASDPRSIDIGAKISF